jgi:hypothetical protein
MLTKILSCFFAINSICFLWGSGWTWHVGTPRASPPSSLYWTLCSCSLCISFLPVEISPNCHHLSVLPLSSLRAGPIQSILYLPAVSPGDHQVVSESKPPTKKTNEALD